MIIWQLVTKSVPYSNFKTSTEMIMAILDQTYETLPSPSTCPQVLIDIIKKSWNHDFTKRIKFKDISTLLESQKMEPMI